jgi:sugar lactone lactonase YvrE
MKMRQFHFRAGLTALAAVVVAGAALAQPKQVWEASGFDQPESAVYDSERDVLYVSNVHGDPGEKTRDGYVSKLSLDGEVVEAQWVTGLDAPLGMDIHESTLYVADIDRIVAIDVESGEITGTYPAEGAQFLNDVTADEQGRVFVSDMMGNRIYVLEDGEVQVWLESEDLESPNGLYAEGDRIVVGAWGVMTDGFETEVPGHLKVVDFETQEVQSLGDGTPVGNLDGVEPDGEGNYLVTDWMAGKLYRITPEGEAEELIDLGQGAADHEYIEEQRLVVIPMMNDGVVVAYELE